NLEIVAKLLGQRGVGGQFGRLRGRHFYGILDGDVSEPAFGTASRSMRASAMHVDAWNRVPVVMLPSFPLARHFQRQSRAKRDAVAADQRGAVDVGDAFRISTG